MARAKAIGVTAAEGMAASVPLAGFATSAAGVRRHPALSCRAKRYRPPKPGDTVSVLESQLNPRSADFQANAAAMQELVRDLEAQVALHAAGGGEAARKKHEARGKLPPRERVQMLLDPGTPFLEIAPLAGHGMYL